VTDYVALITTYNRPQECLRAVRSVLRQTVPPKEVVVVDDASTADYSEVLGLGVTVIQLPQNSRHKLGASYANGATRNVGLQYILRKHPGGWLAFLDDDDEWMLDKAEHQLAVAARHSGCRFVCSNAINRTNALQLQGLHFPAAPHADDGGVADVTSALCQYNPVVNSSAMVSLAVARAVGMQRPVGYPEDFDYWRRCAVHTNLLRLEQPLLYYTTDSIKSYQL